MERGTSVDHVDAVVAIGDRVLRNYWVTQTYADLASGLAILLDPGTANWCTFATWASCTVGRNLRGEDLPGWLHQRVVLADGMMGVVRSANNEIRSRQLDHHVGQIVPEHLSLVVRELFGACATNLSDGNTQVFAEIGPVAATFIECFGATDCDHRSARELVLKACEGATEFDGVNRLQEGFALWCDALTESGTYRRSQLILAGSLQLGAHEQHHLQDAIAGSMDMGVNQSLERLKRHLATDHPGLAAVEASLDTLLHPLGQAVSALWGDLMTELLGTIQTPDGTLLLNRDVPPLPGQPFLPPDVAIPIVAVLGDLLQRFDRASDDGYGSRATDWVDLDDRMNFITNLFRSRHHRQDLFDQPFPPSVREAIERDRIPDPTEATPAGRVASRAGPDASREGRDAARSKRPVSPPSKGVVMFTDEFVETLRNTGDAPADAAVADFFAADAMAPVTAAGTTAAGAAGADRVGHTAHLDLVRRLGEVSSQAEADEDLPGIGAFVRMEEPWPDWADRRLVRDGQRVFGDFGLQLGMGLFMASLPADYACARGVQALARTTRLTHNPKRRYVETGQMIIDVMQPGALEPGQKGYRAVRHVRLMHAAVRHVLCHLDQIERDGAPAIAPWEPEFGLPISQLELLGTLFSFGVEGIEALKRSGVRLNGYQAEAYIHVWNLVGYQIGILGALLPLSWEDSAALWDQRRAREYGPTPEGRELTAAAIECMQELFDFTHLPGLPATGIRHYLGNEIADTLGVPGADWTRVLFEVMQRTDFLYDFALVRLPWFGPVAATLGRRLWRGFELYGRGGDRPAFQVTDELKEAWGMRIE